MYKLLLSSTAMLAMMSPLAVQAAPVVYNDTGAFAAAAATAGASLTTETFSGATYSGTVATTPGFTVTGLTPTYEHGFYSVPAVGTRPNPNPVTFTFAQSINAVGFDVFDLFNLGSETLTLTYAGGSVTLLSGGVGPVGGQNFAGLIDTTTAFNTFTLTTTIPTNYVEFDNVRFGSTLGTPEPASWALMIVGFAAVGYGMRRKAAFKFA